MPLIIDGYNLLHATGVSGRRGDLQGAREALLKLLASTIEPKERALTTIVFDAADAPPSLPRTVMYEDMTIHYASNYDDADEMIEELISKHHVPRSLTVVSSDHRIQRAARRRKAPFLDSDVWLADTMRRRARESRPNPPVAKPQSALTSEEVSYWLGQFAVSESGQEDTKSDSGHARRVTPPAGVDNPFPPGYGEDLLDGA